MVVAFILTFFLKEVPLRTSVNYVRNESERERKDHAIPMKSLNIKAKSEL